MATGGHYNPLNVPHGCITDPVRHVGDLGNITTDANGDTNMNIFSSLIRYFSSLLIFSSHFFFQIIIKWFIVIIV